MFIIFLSLIIDRYVSTYIKKDKQLSRYNLKKNIEKKWKLLDFYTKMMVRL
jgi:hypothetical protein